MKVRGAALACVFVLSACNTSPSAPAAPAQPVASTAPGALAPTAAAAPSAVAAHLGAAITAPEVTLADVAKDPGKYQSQPFTTRGTVTAVCQEMGCWMEIKDTGSEAHLRMHGHSFFVPKSASGRTARVQATLVPANAPAACAEPTCQPKNMAMMQLDATGVELD